jgi:hypothetical protein
MAILVDGLGLVQTELNFTDDEIVAVYRKNFKILEDALSKDVNTLTAADAAAVGDAMAALKNLAQNGMTVTSIDKDGNPIVKLMRVTRDMARQIDLLSRSMGSAGITGSPDIAGILRWRDLGVEGVNILVNRASMAIDNNRSLQSLIELEYVRTGNELLAGQLNTLYDAIASTKKVTEVLTELQGIRNLLKPEARDPIDLDSLPDDDLDAAVEEYNTIAEDAYKDPIDPVVDYKGKNPQDVLRDITQARKDLAEQLTQLDLLNPPPINDQGVAQRDENSLAGKIEQVLNDMKLFFETNGDGNPDISQTELEAWLIDNMDKHIDTDNPELANAAGDVQRNIIGAIQAATNLNDQQKEDFRRYMFVFEEFYKSASAMLSRISQMIEKMAQNAAR